MRTTFSLVAAASAETDLASTWIRKLKIPATTYEELADVEGFKNLDEKLRVAINVRMGDQEGKKRVNLIAEIKRKCDMHEDRGLPEPTGRQYMHMIRTFYQIDEDERELLDMKVLWDLPYWGDSHLHPWKVHWDDLLRRQRHQPNDKNLRSFFVPKLKGSARLAKYLDMYDRSCEGDPEKTYEYIEKMIEKVIKEDRNKTNLNSVTSYYEASSHAPKKHAAPAPTDGSVGTQDETLKDDKKGKGKGGKKGKGDGKGQKGDKGKDGKGGKKGAGKGNDDGGKSGGTPKADDGTKKPDPNRSCITNFFGRCKHGAVLGAGVKCDYGNHRKAPTEADRAHFLFKRMESQHGAWAPGKFPYTAGGTAKANAAAAAKTAADAAGVPTVTPAGSPRGAQNT